jgi:hypothetical protein
MSDSFAGLKGLQFQSVPAEFEEGSSSLFTGSQPGGMRLFAAAMLRPDRSSNLLPEGFQAQALWRTLRMSEATASTPGSHHVLVLSSR